MTLLSVIRHSNCFCLTKPGAAFTKLQLNKHISTLQSNHLTAHSTRPKSSPFYITTPIYYVNGDPHLGHAYTSVMTDIIARFWRLDSREVYFLTGTDEHGQKVQHTALKQNISPLLLASQNSAKFRSLMTALDIHYDDFIRTTEHRHKRAVEYLWNKLLENDMIYLGSYDGWYSVRDEAFYAESELVNGKAPTGADVEWVQEESYFFRLSLFTNKLLEHYEKNADFIYPKGRMKEIISFIKTDGGLKDLSISRTTFDWGVPVPSNPKHVVYVWLDALTNYLSALGYGAPDEESLLLKKFWPASCHIVGKDILRFHAVYWPAFLMAAGIELPKRVFAHGWWTKDGQKMSKSLGNVLDPIELVKVYGADNLRYYLATEIGFGNDGDFIDSNLINRVNSELANNIGNLCQRILSIIQKHFDGCIPSPQDQSLWLSEDRILIQDLVTALPHFRELMDQQNIKPMVDQILNNASNGNKYIDNHKPWILIKNSDSESQDRLRTVIYVVTELIRQLGIILQPVLPTLASKILDQLNISSDQRTFEFISLPIQDGKRIGAVSPIFTKLQPVSKETKECNERTSQEAKEKKSSQKPSFDESLLLKNESKSISEVEELIVHVASEVTRMKAAKAEKESILIKVAELLALKESYRLKTGNAYKVTANSNNNNS